MDSTDFKRAVFDEVLASATVELAQPLTIAQVMTRRPICIEPSVTAYELVQLFHAKRFRHLLVADGDSKLVGVISDRDVLRCFGLDGAPGRERLEAITAADLMSTDVITIQPETTLAEAVNILLTHGINCLPVVSAGKLCGIVTSTDIYLVLERLLERAVVGASS